MGVTRPEDEVLLFLHIPKAAGTTIHRVLRDQFSKRQTFRIEGRDVHGAKARLAALDPDERAALRCVRGHSAFGWHAFFEGRPYSYFTVLREPVDRVVSNYHYVCRSREHYLYDEVGNGGMSIRAYVESGINAELNNGQARLLSGDEELIQTPWGQSSIPYGSNDDALLDRAMRNLDRCEVVGTQAAFAETLIVLKRTYGFRRFGNFTRNRTGGRPAVSALDPETAEAILERNQLDVRLYQHAEQRLAADVARLGSLTWDRGALRLGGYLRPVHSGIYSLKRYLRKLKAD